MKKLITLCLVLSIALTAVLAFLPHDSEFTYKVPCEGQKYEPWDCMNSMKISRSGYPMPVFTECPDNADCASQTDRDTRNLLMNFILVTIPVFLIAFVITRIRRKK